MIFKLDKINVFVAYNKSPALLNKVRQKKTCQKNICKTSVLIQCILCKPPHLLNIENMLCVEKCEVYCTKIKKSHNFNYKKLQFPFMLQLKL